MKRLFLLFLLSFLVYFPLSGQNLRIVRDNIACAYGLKNSNGEWVVEAQFSEIRELNYLGYLVTRLGKIGILDKNGSDIIPPAYDLIFKTGVPNPNSHLGGPAFRNRNLWDRPKPTFIFRQDNKWGLLGHQGNLIFPPEYSRIIPAVPPNLMLHRHDGEKWFSTFADTSGNILLSEREGYLVPVEDGKWFLIMDSGLENAENNRVGVLDAKGQSIVPREFEKIEFFRDNVFKAVRDGKIQKLDAKGNILVAFPYKLAEQNHLDGSLNFAEEAILMIEEKGKFGFMKGDGQVISPPDFDTIVNVQSRNAVPELKYLACKSGKTGTIGETGEVVIPVSFQSLTPISWHKHKNTSHKPDQVFLLAKQGNHYGLLAPTGETLFPCKADTILLELRNHQLYAFPVMGNRFEVLDLTEPLAPNLEIQNRSNLDSIVFFQADNQQFTLKRDLKNPYKFSRLSYSEGNLHRFAGGSLLQIGYQSYLIDNEGQLIAPKSIRSINPNFRNFWSVTTFSGKIGLINPTTGAWTLDTAYTSVNQQHIFDTLFWVIDFPYPKSLEKTGYWKLVNQKGQMHFPELFQSPFDIEPPYSPALIRNKWGVWDNQKQSWMAEPAYSGIEVMDYNTFLVRGEKEKFGLIIREKGLVADTIWENIFDISYRVELTEQAIDSLFQPPSGGISSGIRKEVLIDPHSSGFKFRIRDFHLNQSGPYAKSALKVERWWLLEGMGNEILINQDGNVIRNPAIILQKKVEVAFVDTSNYLNPSLCTHCLQIRTSAQAVKNLETSPLRNEVWLLANRFYERFNKPSKPIIKTRQPFPTNPPEEPRDFHLSYLSNFAWSLQTSYPDRPPPGSFEMPMFNRILNTHNYALQGDSSVIITIDSLFPDEILFEELMIEALQKREDLVLFCNKPGSFLEKTEGRFGFSEEGVFIFLNPKSYFSAVGVTIPWERLQGKAPAGWLVDLFLQAKNENKD